VIVIVISSNMGAVCETVTMPWPVQCGVLVVCEVRSFPYQKSFHHRWTIIIILVSVSEVDHWGWICR